MEEHEKPFHLMAGKVVPWRFSTGWVYINGWEVGPNTLSVVHEMQMRGLRNDTAVHNYFEALAKYICNEKIRQFVKGELGGLPLWFPPWQVTEAVDAPVVVWCRFPSAGRTATRGKWRGDQWHGT